MKLKTRITQDIVHTCPAGSKILFVCDKWITWTEPEDGNVALKNCALTDFECQNDTTQMTFTPEEWAQLKKALKS